ncbi:Stp1/IreP family PP2C-type Ser/Thr phosphatase [Candidatus Magnetobacterium casense]|uniref:Stp1/IreP family PP2C-type Ser/Thr phosphatase n=1 Tax=Candidatus Magnetobacterium casense TaxID=1455061 RepID=A0ABS6RTR1_9BACT|nr:Stp1/IreP family PP2C-type Ser/Thr phosphatase [Candidatus Magnetobacterium casensis]MBV6340007.1 Stp1/IreP family PP2C-type Ser/Thr phosphatase [Candidatus Magnetobacterium casensis]
MTHTISYAGLTDKGRIRKRNEDNWSVDPEKGVYIVSDGMGGHAAGDLASRLVVEMLPILLNKRMKDVTALNSAKATEQLNVALTELNEQVRSVSKSKPGLSGMGATVVLLLVRDMTALLAHMGDSRAYLLRNGKFKQMTMDHSVIQVLINSGEITPEEASTHPARGKITRCIGMAGDALPETMLLELKPGDRILLCSDGLTGMLTDNTIMDIISEYSDNKAACQALIDSANNAGGLDNITVVLVDCQGDQLQTDDIIAISETEDLVSGKGEIREMAIPLGFVINLDKQPSDFLLPVSYPSFSIGRGSGNHLALKNDRTVSRSHCIISVDGDNLRIQDLGSRNGTYLNGRRIKGIVDLPIPSWLSMGRTRIGVIPAGADFQHEALIDEAYTTEGSILIPPSEFFEERTEALLVVDIVGSTRLVKGGETQLVKVVSALGQMLDRSLQNEKHPFLKCTGDGFFATFGAAEDALKSGSKLSAGLARYIKFPVQICVALHWGSVRLTQEGERTGRNAHAVFSLEDLRHKEKNVTALLTTNNKKEIILMTEAFWNMLEQRTRAKAVAIGMFNLKGLDKEEKIFHWPT